MRKAVEGAGRGLKGKRNEQGDFIPLDEDTIFGDVNKGETSANFQEYIDNAKEDIESLTEILDQVELMDPTNKKEIKALMDERDEVIKELYHYLEINDIATPREIRDMLDPLTKTSRGEGPIS